MNPIVEFTVHGSASAISHTIERYAAERRVYSVLVVPWESSAGVLRMAVTSPRGEGWAIEHTNLGTITLTDVGDGRISVAVIPPDLSRSVDPVESDAVDQRMRALTSFGHKIKEILEAAGQPRLEQPR